MKKLYLLFLFLLTCLTFGQNHNTLKIELDYYSFEEAFNQVQDQYQYQDSYMVWHCDLPILLQWVCGTPFYPQPEYNQSNEAKTEFNRENLIQYYSLIDLDAMRDKYSDYLHYKIAFTLNQQDFPQKIGMPEHERQEFISYAGFESWDDYVTDQNEQIINQVILDVFAKYADGFVQLNDFGHGGFPIQSWSALKFSHGLRWTHFPFVASFLGRTTVLKQAEAESFFGAKPVLVQTTHSLFFEDLMYDSKKLYDELVWVYGDKAIGFFSRKNYQIVDENGQPLAILEDGVTTRFGTKKVLGYEAIDIRLLFDMVEIED